jgi:hypothetical protein
MMTSPKPTARQSSRPIRGSPTTRTSCRTRARCSPTGRTANGSPAAQQRLVADRWRLWRLARDLAGALDNTTTGERTAQ